MASPGSVSNVSYAPNGLNQITTGGGVGWTHDDRGNATAVGANAYTYDIANRMTGLANSSIALTWDPVGRLYEHAGSSTTRFQYDGADLIAEYNTSGTVQRRYVHGPGTDEPLVWFEGAGTSTPKYLVADERGSIVAVTDGSGGVLATNTYDEYGLPGTTDAAHAGRFRYTGQTWLSDLGLYNYKARMYAPDFGRFLQTDPIGYGDGMNMYAYVGGDPVNGRDPTGTRCIFNGAAVPCDSATSERNPGRPCAPFDDYCVLNPAIHEDETTTVEEVVVVGKRRPGCTPPRVDRSQEAKVGRLPHFLVVTPLGFMSRTERADVFNRWRDGASFAPGGSSGTPDETAYLLDYVPGHNYHNWVYLTTDRPNLKWTNWTLPGHVFEGRVSNSIRSVFGYSFMVSYGSGGMQNFLLNATLGPKIFKMLQLTGLTGINPPSIGNQCGRGGSF